MAEYSSCSAEELLSQVGKMGMPPDRILNFLEGEHWSCFTRSYFDNELSDCIKKSYETYWDFIKAAIKANC